MDPLKLIVRNARDKLGCNGLRNLTDLAQMRQETLEKRLVAAGRSLSCQNMASIYSAWLSEKICQKPLEDARAIVAKMCLLLWRAGCQMKLALDVWLDCAEGQARMTWQTPVITTALHSIGEVIFALFPRGEKGPQETSLLKAVRSAERPSPKNRDRSRSPRKPMYSLRSSGDSYRPRRSPRPPLSGTEPSQGANSSQQCLPLQTTTDESWKAYFYDVVRGMVQ